jgi:hypothetical protein
MAIKGKKKTRGSQARRRPSSAPRPAVAPRRAPTWYNSPAGIIVLAVGSAGIVALVVAAVVNAFGGSNAPRAASASALRRYTLEVQSLQQTLAVPVGAMQNIPGDGGDLSHVAEQARGWEATLTQLEDTIGNQAAPAALQPVNALLGDAVAGYGLAAKSYALAARLPAGRRSSELRLAAEARSQANSVWAAAISILDRMRADAGLGESNVPAPARYPATGPRSLPGAETRAPR